MWRDVLHDLLKNHLGKLMGSVIGFIVAVLIIFFGFFKTLFIIFCVLVGYFIGKKIDNNDRVSDFLDRILPPGF